MEAIDAELQQLAGDAVPCRGCGHGYPQHADAGGRCRVVINDRFPCFCTGFRWVDPGGPPVGSYADPPTPV
jgi:hypothetical protein